MISRTFLPTPHFAYVIGDWNVTTNLKLYYLKEIEEIFDDQDSAKKQVEQPARDANAEPTFAHATPSN